MNVNAQAQDTGIGLDHIVVTVDERKTVPAGAPALRTVTVPVGSCTELTPGDGTIDRAFDAATCLGAHAATAPPPQPKDQPPVYHVPTTDLALLTPETGQQYYRTVTLYDVAGNARVLVGELNGNGSVTGQPFDIWHPSLGSPTQTLTIGTTPLAIPEGGTPPPPNPGSGGVGGASRSSCGTPRLSVMLRTKPLRIRKGVPVLRYKKKYRFTGRLTCVIDGRRKAAPKRTRIAIYNKVGKRTVGKPRTLIRGKGRLNVRLAFVSSRTVIFRFTASDGQRSQVSIKVRVEKKKKKARR